MPKLQDEHQIKHDLKHASKTKFTNTRRVLASLPMKNLLCSFFSSPNPLTNLKNMEYKSELKNPMSKLALLYPIKHY